MEKREDSRLADLIRFGPIRVVDIFTPRAPKGVKVADALGQETVPFDQIRHLCSAKPLGRYFRNNERA